MKTLADRLLEILPAYPLGPTIAEAAKHLAAGAPFVSRAFHKLDEAGRAILVRRKGALTLYLVPLGYPILACKNCHAEFQRKPKSKAVCCSRACSVSWSWRQPGVAERRKASIRQERQSPAAVERLAAHNKRRWAKPEERAKASEQNRKQWADPVARAKRSASIQAVHGSPEGRRRHSEIRRKAWADPAKRARYVEKLRSRGKKYSYQGRELYLVELAELSGINLRTLRERLVYRGWPVEKAMQPVRRTG